MKRQNFDLWSDIIAMEKPFPQIRHLLLLEWLFFKWELITSNRCVEMDIPWQLCRTIGPLLSHRFRLASAKAQPGGDFKPFEFYPWLQNDFHWLHMPISD